MNTRSAAVVVGIALMLTTVRAHDPITTKVTWNGEIARIVDARCVRCHEPDGRGPMSLATWEDARPWAKAIKEEVLTRRMPKWHAARGYGDFSNDPSLSPFDIALIVSWADGGAPRGEPAQDERLRPAPSAKARGASERGWGPASTEKSGQDTSHAEDRLANTRSLRCGSQPLAGRLLAIRPQLQKGGAAFITADLPDGRREIVAWIRDFDPDFAETYWLRTPLDLPPRSRLTTVADKGCSITVILGGQERQHGENRR